MPRPAQDLLELARAACARHGADLHQPVAVACSGGPDSTALADVASELFARVTLIYVDHQLRAESAADGGRVAALAERLGVEARTVAVEVPRDRGSLEGAAREVRYAALERLADELGVCWVLLGHTASDQAETVFMRVVRGTGVPGLAGIPERRGRYLRPLLKAPRAAVLAHLVARQLLSSDDAMNRDARFFRTRVRRRWLPALAEENPRIEEALCRLADAAAEQRAALECAAGSLPLEVEALRAAPPAVAKLALARAAQLAGGGELGALHLDECLALVRREAAGTVELSLPGLTVRREYERIEMRATSGSGRPAASTGPTTADDGPGPDIEVRGPDAPYRVRTWQRGDRMRPARLAGHSRKLSDLFADAKVPAERRLRALVVVRVQDGEIVWAEHIGYAHGAQLEVTLTRPGATATNGE